MKQERLWSCLLGSMQLFGLMRSASLLQLAFPQRFEGSQARESSQPGMPLCLGSSTRQKHTNEAQQLPATVSGQRVASFHTAFLGRGICPSNPAVGEAVLTGK